MSKEDPVKRVLECFQEAWSATTNRRDGFMDFYRNYRQMYESDDEEQFLNNVFSTITLETIETFRPYLTSIPPDISVLPSDDMQNADAAKRVEEWQRYQWYCQGMDTKRKKIVFFMLLYGTAVLYHYYRLESEKLPTKFFNPNGSVEIKGVETSLYDDPDCEVVDIINDFLPDPFGKSVATCNYIIYRRYMHINELKRLSKGDEPWFTETPSVDEIGQMYEDFYTGTDRNAFDRYGDDKEIATAAKRNMVEVLEYWEDDRLVIVANRDHLLRDSKNPYYRIKKKPFSVFYDVDNPHEIWGIGEGEILAKGQHELNFIKRARQDIVKRLLKPGFIAPTGSGFDPAGYYREEGLTIETALPDMIKPLPLPTDYEQIGLQSEMELKSDQENATAATPLFKGAMRQASETATAGRIQQSNVLSRANYKVDNFSDGIKQWMEWNVGLASIYYPEYKKFRVRTQHGFNIGMVHYQDFLRGLTYEIASASAHPTTRDDRLMQADMLFTRFMQNPFVRQDQLIQIVMKLMDVPYQDRLLKTQQEVQADQQQALAASQEQQTRMENNEIAKQMLDKALAEPKGMEE